MDPGSQETGQEIQHLVFFNLYLFIFWIFPHSNDGGNINTRSWSVSTFYFISCTAAHVVPVSSFVLQSHWCQITDGLGNLGFMIGSTCLWAHGHEFNAANAIWTKNSRHGRGRKETAEGNLRFWPAINHSSLFHIVSSAHDSTMTQALSSAFLNRSGAISNHPLHLQL